jgi:hypothetical protein
MKQLTPYGRGFAVAYLGALAAAAVALLLLLIVRAAWPVLIIVAAAAVLVVLANVLGRRDPSLDGRAGPGGLSNYQYAWWTLLLGGEVRRSLALLRGQV